MDPDVLVAALTAGATAGVKDTATSAVKDAYAAVKSALRDRFRGRPQAGLVLAEHEAAPATWQAPLEQYVREVGVDEALQALVEQLQQALQAQRGVDRRVQINADTINGQYVGDHGTQTNSFN